MSCENSISIKRNPFATVPTKVTAALKDMQQTGWEINEKSMEVLASMGKDAIMKLAGYIENPKESARYYDEIESIKGKNLAIEREVDELLVVWSEIQDRKRQGLPTTMYFDWFIAKNNRFHLDSAGVNPQTNKMHRFLFHTEKQTGTITPKSLKMYKLAIAQAFGYSIDKNSTKDAIAFVDKVLNAKEFPSLLSQFKQGNMKVKIANVDVNLGEHPTQALTALTELQSYRAAILDPKKLANQKNLKTTLTFEVDALTSGFGLKLLQYANTNWNKFYEYAAKTGMIFNNAIDANTGMSDKLSINHPEFLDSYQSLASTMADRKSFINSIKSSIAANMDDPDNILLNDLIGNTSLDTAINNLMDIMPDLTNKDGSISKFGRELNKYPFMTYQYGAGETSLKLEVANGLLSSFIPKLAQYALKVDSNKLTDDEIAEHARIKKFVDSFGIKLEYLKEMQTKPLNTIKLANGVTLERTLTAILKQTYGAGVVENLQLQFKPLADATANLNGMFNIMYAVFEKYKQTHEKEIGRALSKAEEVEFIKKNMKIFPHIKMPLGKDGSTENIVFYSQEVEANPKDEQIGTFIRDEDGKTTFAGMGFTSKMIAAPGVSPGVNIVHTIDASIMALVLNESGALGVHDALVVGVNQAGSMVKQYNETVYMLNKNWSMFEEAEAVWDAAMSVPAFKSIYEDMVAAEIKKTAKGDKKGFSKSAIQLLKFQNTSSSVIDSREEIFSQQARVEHMVLDAEYSYNVVPENKTTLSDTAPLTSLSQLQNYSGGAYGADKMFDVIGKEFGVNNNVHFRAPNNTKLAAGLNQNSAYELTDREMRIAYLKLEKLLGKKLPKTLENDLKARNYYQVKNADAVFAIATIDTVTNTYVTGGTNVAVEFAKQAEKPIYVWDIPTEQWYEYSYTAKEFITEKDFTPVLTKRFAGVGSRTIEQYNVRDKKTNEWKPTTTYVGNAKRAKAEAAVRALYTNTLKSIKGISGSNLEETSNKYDTITEAELNIIDELIKKMNEKDIKDCNGL